MCNRHVLCVVFKETHTLKVSTNKMCFSVEEEVLHNDVTQTSLHLAALAHRRVTSLTGSQWDTLCLCYFKTSAPSQVRIHYILSRSGIWRDAHLLEIDRHLFLGKFNWQCDRSRIIRNRTIDLWWELIWTNPAAKFIACCQFFENLPNDMKSDLLNRWFP